MIPLIGLRRTRSNGPSSSVTPQVLHKATALKAKTSFRFSPVIIRSLKTSTFECLQGNPGGYPAPLMPNLNSPHAPLDSIIPHPLVTFITRAAQLRPQSLCGSQKSPIIFGRTVPVASHVVPPLLRAGQGECQLGEELTLQPHKYIVY